MSGKGKGIKPLELGLLQSEAERNAVLDAAAADVFGRLVARADEMEIPRGPDQGWLLALAVLEQYDPEFKAQRKDGRPEKWDVLARITLANLIALVMHVGWPKVRACEHLAANDPWLCEVEGRPDGKALERQCTKQRLAVARKAVADAASAGRLDVFAAEVRRNRDFLAQREKQK